MSTSFADHRKLARGVPLGRGQPGPSRPGVAAVVAVVLALAACGAGQAAPLATTSAAHAPNSAADAIAAAQAGREEEGGGRLVRVTVVAADLAGLMANGEQWDDKDAPSASEPGRPLLSYWSLHPELEDTRDSIGIPVGEERLDELARDSPAADPMVLVEIGPLVFRTPVRPRAFQPLWAYPFEFLYGEVKERRGVAAGELVRVHVVDFDGPRAYDTIGSMVMSVDELLAHRLHRLGPFGRVNSLTLEVLVQRPPEGSPEPRSARLAIPGSAGWTDTGIDLTAGHRVRIDAADEVCSKKDSLRHCSGPEGQREISSYNVHGFEKLGHAALIAAVGDTRFAVGRQLRFMAPSSGRLYLGINDRKVSDNRGSYAVRVVIEPLP